LTQPSHATRLARVIIRHLLAAACSLSLLAAGCTSPSVTAPIDNEPVCPDFALGVTKTMHKGGLRHPVRVRVMDDDDIRSERILLGRRTAEASHNVVVVKDDDQTYKILWQQCGNPFAPRRLLAGKQPTRTTGYTCGEAKTYHEQDLAVRQGDPKSRRLRYIAPPDPACWTGTAAAAPNP
jgi:hypothetical protein